MTRLARKVTLAKWKGAEWATIDRIPADALSVDLKTSGNTLSFWRANADGNGEDAAILAVLGTQQRLEKIDIAFVRLDSISSLDIQPIPGTTVFEDLRHLHVDIANLDQQSLLQAAKAIGAEIFGETTKRITKQEFKARMQDAVNGGKISWDLLPEEIRRDLKRPSA